MVNKSDIKRKILYFSILSVVSLITALIIQYVSGLDKNQEMSWQEDVENVLRMKEEKLQNILENVLDENYSNTPFITLHRDLKADLWYEEGFSVFLYRNDSLVYWSDNNVPAENYYNKALFSRPHLHYGNGWFRVLTERNNNLKAVGLILVKNDFPYQNEYLVNDFQKEFKLPSSIEIDTVPGDINITSREGMFLFSMAPDHDQIASSSKTNFIIFILFLVCFVAVIFLLFYLYLLIDFFRRNPVILLVAFIADAILLRFVLLYFKIPGYLYNTELFSPYHYATSFISPSLGDLLVNSMFWLSLAWIFHRYFNISLANLRKPAKLIISFLLMLFAGLLFYLLISTLRKMVIDSNIELNLNSIFNIDIYSVLGFLAITSLFLAFFLVSSRISIIISKSQIKPYGYIALALVTAVLAVPLFWTELAVGPGLVYPALLLLYLLSFLYFFNKPGGFRNITGALVYIVLFSLIATFVLDFYHGVKEKENRKILANELSSKRDPLMEYEFSRMKSQMISDTVLIGMLNQRETQEETDARIISYLDKTYFNSFWNLYELLITICKSDEVLNIQPGGYLLNCYDYFDGLLETPGSEMITPGLFFLNSKMENNNYIAVIRFPVPETREDSVMIFIELFYKYISETGLGYPDLLIDKKVRIIPGQSNYSYAKYVDDKLIYKNGDFSYHLGFQNYENPDKKSYLIDNEGYNHYIFKADDSNKLIISKKSTTWLDLIAPFSYLFIIFSLFLLMFLLGYMLAGGYHRLEFNFSNRLQVSIILIILISFLILGLITRSNIIHLYNNKNRDNLSEKTFSVLTELEHKLGEASVLSEDLHGYISEYLNKFSVVFFSDINLYDTKGNLIASSRPQIFEEKLLSYKMNTGAFYKLAFEQSLLYIQNEKIGRQEYLSAYIPFRNNEDQIIAYLNLPYFAKQTELRKEIGDFLSAYINVYVLLIVLAIMVTIIISRFITRPLQLIREKLSDIGLGKSNEKIQWKRKDEIGNLIEEYNRMIDELAKSAEMLARSERESAWREMAKQVAHEIKNPLTPMKLSVQYLQKAWYDKAPDWEKRLEIFTRTIVEQIDALSEIASEFSDFAKMPVANIEKIELTGIIKSAAELYQHHRNIRISVNHLEQPYYVLADKRQLLRVFNNLLQNSVQAIGKKDDGYIRIEISRDEADYVIGISDNGTGITDEQAEKIFSPSFTTKSSGMGLGLAMVKSILTTIEGKVSFKSDTGTGTTFTIRIPVCKV